MRDLRSRGHDVRVLTTDYRRDTDRPDDEDVHRDLRWYWHEHDFPRLGVRDVVALERHNAEVFDRHVADLRPDVVSWWAMGGMSLSLLERARRQGLPAVGFVIDDWLLYGPRFDRWLARVARPGRRTLARRLTGLPARLGDRRRRPLGLRQPPHPRLRPARSSAAARRGHRPRRNRPRADPARSAARMGLEPALLGRIDERKGIDTAVDALPHLPPQARSRWWASGDDASWTGYAGVWPSWGRGSRSLQAQPPARQTYRSSSPSTTPACSLCAGRSRGASSPWRPWPPPARSSPPVRAGRPSSWPTARTASCSSRGEPRSSPAACAAWRSDPALRARGCARAAWGSAHVHRAALRGCRGRGASRARPASHAARKSGASSWVK